jgi:hypothetical protein
MRRREAKRAARLVLGGWARKRRVRRIPRVLGSVPAVPGGRRLVLRLSRQFQSELGRTRQGPGKPVGIELLHQLGDPGAPGGILPARRGVLAVDVAVGELADGVERPKLGLALR